MAAWKQHLVTVLTSPRYGSVVRLVTDFLAKALKKSNSKAVKAQHVVDTLKAMAAEEGMDDVKLMTAAWRIVHGKPVDAVPSVDVQHVNRVFTPASVERRSDLRTGDIELLLPADVKVEAVLDLGCGDGSILATLQKKYNVPKDRAYGVDAVELTGDLPFTYLTPGDMATLPDKSVDLVVAAMSLHHIDKLEDTLAQVYRILSPNGRFVVREHDVAKDDGSTTLFLSIVHAMYALVLTDPQEDPVFYDTFYAGFFQKSELVTTMARLGMKEALPPTKQVMQLARPYGPQRVYYTVFSK